MDCIAVNGQLVTIVPTDSNNIAKKIFLKNVSLHYEFMGIPTVHNIHPERQGEFLATLRNLVDAGLLRPHVYRKINLEDLPQGHTLQENGHVVGKIAVEVS